MHMNHWPFYEKAANRVIFASNEIHLDVHFTYLHLFANVYIVYTYLHSTYMILYV